MTRKNKIKDKKPYSQKASKIRDPTDTGVIKSPWQPHLIWAAGTSAVSLAIYFKTLYPSLPGGDSGELIVSALEMGVAHPPGYPLFTLLTKCIMMVCPFGSLAWRAHLLNAIFSATAVGLLQLAVLRLTNSLSASLMSAGLFAWSQLTWTWAITAEVFGLNNFFISVIIVTGIYFEERTESLTRIQVSKIGAFLCGLSLCNQHTIVIYILCVALWVVYTLFKNKDLSFNLCLQLAVYFLLGLLPYVYLPISAYMNVARWSWGDHLSLRGLIRHLLREEYGTFDLGKDQAGLGFIHGIRAYIEHTLDAFLSVGPILAVIGIVGAVKRLKSGRPSVFIFYTMLMLYMLFFAWRANLDTSNPLFRGVVERFWLQSDLVLVLLVGVGFSELNSWLLNLSQSSRVTEVFGWLVCSSVCFLQLKTNYYVCDQSTNTVIVDFATSVLTKMPENAVIFTRGDLSSITLRYFHLCENMRPDITLLDQETMSYSWFFPMNKKFLSNLNIPGDMWHLQNGRNKDGRTIFNFKHLLDKNYDKFQLFVCIGMQDRDPSWQQAYELWPYGACQKIVKRGTRFQPQIWKNETERLADKWSYGFESFDARSWETVANNVMWHGKIGTPYFMYDQAVLTEAAAAKMELLLEAYGMYTKAMEENKDFPIYWNKNYAIVCEKLLYIHKHNLNKLDLLKKTIHHFKVYAKETPEDEQNVKIEAAVKSLENQLSSIQAEIEKKKGKM